MGARDNNKRTCMPPKPSGRDGRNVTRNTRERIPNQQRRPRQEYERDARAGRRVSVLRPGAGGQSREPPQVEPRQQTFVRRNRGSRESIQVPSARQGTAAQRWFAVVMKQGGVRRIRQRFVNDLQQFKSKGKTTAFDDERNADFNRYTDVALLDSTRVKLKNGPGGSDYIHASQVSGADFPIICAQGPVEESIDRFWTMIVEQKCGVIVQLCQNEEDGKEKCAAYIPSSDSRVFGKVTVRVKEATKALVANPSVHRTVLEASMKSGKQEVHHFLYDGWPDHDVPLSPTSFRQLRAHVHKIATTKKCPVVVHCSAGIGRTGTYAAVEIAVRELIEQDKETQMSTIFQKLREQRTLAIQNDLQYLFLHRAVVDAAVDAGRLTPEDKTRMVNAFIKEYEELVMRKRKERKELMKKR